MVREILFEDGDRTAVELFVMVNPSKLMVSIEPVSFNVAAFCPPPLIVVGVLTES
jgi:hypothetical protein